MKRSSAIAVIAALGAMLLAGTGCGDERPGELSGRSVVAFKQHDRHASELFAAPNSQRRAPPSIKSFDTESTGGRSIGRSEEVAGVLTAFLGVGADEGK